MTHFRIGDLTLGAIRRQRSLLKIAVAFRKPDQVTSWIFGNLEVMPTVSVGHGKRGN